MKRKILYCSATLCAAACLLVLLLLAKPAQKAETNLFSCGLLPVREEKLWGYVNTAGEMVIQPQFQEASRFDETGRAIVWAKGESYLRPQCAMIDASGNYIFCPGEFKELREIGLSDRVGAKTEDGWGVIGLDGEWILEPQFGKLGLVSKNGLLRAQNDGSGWGFVDATGNWVVEPQYRILRDFGDSDRAWFCVQSKWGAIDETGSVVIEPLFDSLRAFDAKGMAAAAVDGKWGFVGRNGNWVIPPEFEDVSTQGFGANDAAWASVDGVFYGLIDREGKCLTPQCYRSAGVFSGGLTRGILCDDYNVSCLLNEQGEVVLGPMRNLGMSRDGETVWFTEFDQIEFDQVGYMNLKGEVVLEPQFDSHFVICGSPNVGFSFFSDGYAAAKLDGYFGVIDREGNWVVPPVYDKILQPDY